MSSQHTQYHVHKLQVVILTTDLSVRFPCSIQYQLKYNGNVQQSHNSFELKNGKCQPLQRLAMDIDVQYSNGQFLDAKIMLNVIMVSVNGKVPAGGVAITVAEGGRVYAGDREETRYIDKCADKSAKMTYQIKCTHLRTITKNRNTSTITKSAIKFTPKISASNSEALNLKDLLSVAKKHTIAASHVNLNISHQNENLSQSHVNLNSHASKNRTFFNYQNVKKKVKGSEKSQSSEQGKSQRSQSEKESIYGYQNKSRCADSRTYLNFDKYSIKDNISQHTPQPLTRLKSELQSQSQQLQCYRQKNTQLQHKIREQLHQIRQYKDNVDKLKSKINSLDNINYELKSTIEEKQRCVEKLLGELKVMKEYCEQVRVGVGMQDKKNEMKQSVHNEHIKKLTQKYQKSQSQRQNLLQTLSRKLSQFQQTQKQSQQAYKQKERVLLEQKNKISKKLETTLNSLQNLIEQHTELKNQFQLLTNNCHKLEKSKRQLEADVEQKGGKIGELEDRVRMLEGRVRELEGEVVGVGQLEGKINQGNKKYQQLNAQFSKLKQQNQNLTQKLQLQTRLHHTSQLTLKQTQQQIHSQSTRITSLTHSVQTQTQKQQQLQQKIEQLQKSYASLQQQYTTIEQKYYIDVQKLQQINTKLENQVRYLCKSKETIFQEYQQMKWKVGWLEEREIGGRRDVRQAGEAVGKAKEELYAEQEKYRKQVQKCKQLQIQVQTLQQQLHQQSQKHTQQSQTLKKTSSTLHQTQTQLLHLQSQYKQSSEQLTLLQSTMQQQKHKYSILQQQLNKTSILHEEEIDKLSSINQQIQDELICARRDLLTAKAEYEDVRGEVGGLKGQVRRLEGEIGGKEEQVRGLEVQVSALKEAEKKYIAQIKNKDLEIVDIKNQFDKFKVQLSTNIQLLTSQIPKLEKPPSIPLNSLPSYLHPLYSRFQKYTTQTIQKFCTQNQNFNNQIQQLQQQLRKEKKNNKQLAQQFEEQMMMQKIKYNEFVGQSMTEKNELINKLEKMEERVGQLEGEVAKLRVRGGEYEVEIKEWREKVNELQQQIQLKQKTLHKKQSEYRQQQKQLQYLRRNPSNISVNTEQQRLIIEKQKNSIKELQKKLGEVQKQLNQRQQSIRNLQNSLVSKTYQLEKEKRNCQDTSKIVQMLRGNVKGLKDDGLKMEGMIGDLQTKLQAMNKQVQAQKYKNEDLSLKLQKSQSETSQLAKQLQLQSTTHLQTQQTLKSQLQASLQGNQRLQKQAEQAQKHRKQSEQKLIQTTSKLQLSQFMIEQLQQQISQIKNNNAQYLSLLDKKKNQIIYLNSVIQGIKSQNLVLRNQCEGLRVERDGLHEQETSLKAKLEVLGVQVADVGVVQDMLEKQRKENQKLRNYLESANSKCSTMNKQFQSITQQYKKQLSTKLCKQEQFKKRIRDLQKQIQSNMHEKSLILSNKEQTHTRERTDLLSAIEQLEEQNDKYRIMYQNLREQSKKELEILNQQCAQLTGLLTQKEQLLCVKDEKIRECEGKVKVLMGQLKQCMEAWEVEKKEDGGKGANLESKAAKIMGEVDARSRKLLTSFNKPAKIN